MKLSFSAFALCCLANVTLAQPIDGPVGIGQTAYANGPIVRPDRVIEDSRCPADVQCVHAGRLIVRVTVTGGAWSMEIDLTLGTPVPVADGQLTLAEVSPERATHDVANALPYRFTFLFQGGR